MNAMENWPGDPHQPYRPSPGSGLPDSIAVHVYDLKMDVFAARFFQGDWAAAATYWQAWWEWKYGDEEHCTYCAANSGGLW